MLMTFGNIFLTFGSFGSQVGSGCYKVAKVSSENQKKLVPFDRNSVFFL